MLLLHSDMTLTWSWIQGESKNRAGFKKGRCRYLDKIPDFCCSKLTIIITAPPGLQSVLTSWMTNTLAILTFTESLSQLTKAQFNLFSPFAPLKVVNIHTVVKLVSSTRSKAFKCLYMWKWMFPPKAILMAVGLRSSASKWWPCVSQVDKSLHHMAAFSSPDVSCSNGWLSHALLSVYSVKGYILSKLWPT